MGSAESADSVGKTSAVGEMTSGIVHELKTPLAGISIILSGVELAKQLHQEIDMDATCSRIDLLVQHCSAIIEHMRNYSRLTEETHSQTQIIFLYTLLSVAWAVFKALVHLLTIHSFPPLSQSSCFERQRSRRFRRKITDFSLRSLRF